MKPTKFLGYLSGKLIKGCQECVLGRKTVLFITGKCSRNCYYCPLPESRKEKDVVYTNERKLSNVNAVGEAIEEAKLCSSKGIGITGGDPLLVLKRTIKFVNAFKKKFGKKFHIHIYLPTDIVSEQKLEKLAKAGIDEIRFHPYFLSNDVRGLKAIESAWQLKKKYHWKVGIEIPAVPSTEKQTIEFLKKVKNLDFLNLNEFEMPSFKGEQLIKKGMKTVGNSVAIKGSRETALRILKTLENKVNYPIHYCSAATKNSFQFKNRLKRRIKNVKKPYDVITKDNNLFHAAIYLQKTKPLFNYEKKIGEIKKDKKQYSKIIRRLILLRRKFISEFHIPENLIEVDKQFLRILTTPAILKFVSDIKYKNVNIALVTELPTYDKIILNLEWLYSK
ncbi:MAG: radical SAM protein [Candidatus Pacearchaeota archaeon]